MREAGCVVEEVVDGPIDLLPAGVVLITGNPQWFPQIRRQLVARPRADRPFVVIWHSEPLPPPRASGLPMPRLYLREIARIMRRDPGATDVYTNYLSLRGWVEQGLVDLLLVSTSSRQEFLAEKRIAAYRVPLGYHRSHGCDMGLERDVDVLFLGTLAVPRRGRMVRRLRTAGVDFITAGDWFDPSFWGEDRTRLLNRTKIFLNIQRYAGEFSGLRMIHGMANKTLVMSEPMYCPDPYVPGLHYVSATIDEMPEAIRYYLADGDKREQIAQAGHHLVTQEVTMERSVLRIMELIQEHV